MAPSKAKRSSNKAQQWRDNNDTETPQQQHGNINSTTTATTRPTKHTATTPVIQTTQTNNNEDDYANSGKRTVAWHHRGDRQLRETTNVKQVPDWVRGLTVIEVVRRVVVNAC